MPTRQGLRRSQLLLAGVLAGVLALSLTPRLALAEYKMARADYDHIDKMTKDVKDALLLAKKPEELAQNAALAVRASMIASYAQGASKDQVEKNMDTFFSPYVSNPGPTRRTLTDIDSDQIEKAKTSVRHIVEPRLTQPYADAVVFTAGLTAQKILEGIDQPPTPENQFIENVLGGIATKEFAELPPKTDPNSPFHRDEIAIMEAPAPATAASAPASPAQPTFEQLVADNPDGAVSEHNGHIVVAKPDGEGGTIYVEYPPADDNKNEGNTKNRTGGDDKKEDKKGNNSSGGGHK